MESKIRYVLKHKQTGLYISHIAQQTAKLFDAWRFLNEEQAQVWLQVSNFKPDNPDEYTLIPVNMTIEETETNVQQERIHKEHSRSIS